ncbi:MAG: hypothetical protein LWW93_17645 [Hyphomicrobiales bacterium]|nr:hypothetical protein [Hyphomicrobiales bacterium]
MRGILGHVGAAAIAAMVATIWILLRSNGESLISAFHIPDAVAYVVPDLAIGLRRLLAVYREASPPIAVLIDLPAGTLIFLALNLPGAILLHAAETTWGETARWQTYKPLWGGLAYAVTAAEIVVAGLVFDWPVLGHLTLSPIGATLAALFAGAILGLTPPKPREPLLWYE